MDKFIQNLVSSKTFNNILHVGLMIAAVYVAGNPKYAWLAPLIQGVGQSVEPPK